MPRHTTEDLAQRYKELTQEQGKELNESGETSRFEQLGADANQLYEFVPEEERSDFVRLVNS